MLVLRELHDEDRVLRGEAHEEHEPELRVDAQAEAVEAQAHERAQDGHEDGEHDGKRDRPALVLRDEEEVAEDDGERDERRGAPLVARLLEGERVPGVAVAVGQLRFEDLAHRVHDGAGGDAGLRHDRDATRHVLVARRDGARPELAADRAERADRHHRPLVRAHVEPRDGLRRVARARLGGHGHAVHLRAEVHVVHVARAEVVLERGVDDGDRHVEHLRLHAVEVEAQLRRLGVEARERGEDERARVELREDGVLHAVERDRVGARLVQNLHRDAVRVAEAGDRGGREHLPLRLGDRGEDGRDLRYQRRKALRRLGALAPALEVHDEHGKVLAAPGDHAPAGDRKDARHLGDLAQLLHGAQRDVARAVARRALGHVHRAEDHALVLVRQERGLGVHEEARREEDREHEQHGGEEDAAREPLRRRHEEALEALDAPVEPRKRAVLERPRLVEEERAEGRRECERAHGREAHGGGERDGELLVDAPRDAAHEPDRHEDAE